MSFLINSYALGTPIPTGNLVLYQRFNNSMTDQTGNHSPTLVSGATYGLGVYSGNSNESIILSGDYVNVPDDDLLSFGDSLVDSPFSISFAVNMTSIRSDFNWLVDKRDNSTASQQREYAILVNKTGGGGEFQFTLFDQSTGATINAKTLLTASASTNYHIVCTYDGSGNESGLTIYVGGVDDTNTRTNNGNPYTAMENGTGDLVFGKIKANGLYPLTGRLDGIGVWDKELNQAEVTAIYNEQSAGNELL